MRINKLEERIIALNREYATGNNRLPFHSAEIIAFAECVFHFLNLSLQKNALQIKQQLADREFDGTALFSRYKDILNRYPSFSRHDASDILMFYPDRLAIEIYVDYYPKVDFSDILNMDSIFFDLLRENKTAALECIHRLYRRNAIKIGNKAYLPRQYQRLKDKCSAYF